MLHVRPCNWGYFSAPTAPLEGSQEQGSIELAEVKGFEARDIKVSGCAVLMERLVVLVAY